MVLNYNKMPEPAVRLTDEKLINQIYDAMTGFFTFCILEHESRQVFYVVGHKFRIFFLREPEADGYVDAMTAASATCPTNAEYLSVTEGHFEADGTYTADVCRTGDEARHGAYAQWDSNVLRIELLEIE